jgi:predicted transcriptional regulator
MDKYQAEKIINNYGSVIANDGNPFKKKTTLPCSKAKIRYAFYVYIAAIINEIGELPKNIGENLVATYSMLDAFVSDEKADRLNKISEKIKTKELVAEKVEDKKQIDEYFSLVFNALNNSKYSDEINEYIKECSR